LLSGWGNIVIVHRLILLYRKMVDQNCLALGNTAAYDRTIVLYMSRFNKSGREKKRVARLIFTFISGINLPFALVALKL